LDRRLAKLSYYHIANDHLQMYTTLGAINLHDLGELLTASDWLYSEELRIGKERHRLSLAEVCYYAWDLAGVLDKLHSVRDDVMQTEMLNQEQIKDALETDEVAGDIIKTTVRFLDRGYNREKRRGGVFHRDVKAENVVIRVENGQPMLIDYALARYNRAYKDKSQCPHYMAPEVHSVVTKEWKGEECKHEEKPFYDYVVDVWSLAFMVFRRLVGRFPLPTEKRVWENCSSWQKTKYIREKNMYFAGLVGILCSLLAGNC